ncbi:chemotaxis protein CheW [Thiomicrorhabdus sediminis]|uniref:Chemotaxis protein CheW n=1 Tax=Thiomicrorhabdus sediminis TaxID=2580412 RepID=A0A4P9K6D2_9GAMM|nr:chemotaxis protein CheW [Thiomicrorhabdus sediminis]QCU90428.1 purine-binding chemotaxis protein CheW [Thiomicrorhabdus sediminis]
MDKDMVEKDIEDIHDQIEQHKDNADDQVLSFVLGNEEYGVDILRVQEIKGWEKTTAIPNTPSYVMGVINLRGSVVPIIDLRVRFGLQEITYNDSTVVIIVRSTDSAGTQKIIGLVVDGVSDVYGINKEELQSSPEMTGMVHTEYVNGLATVGDKMVIVLHVDQLINDGILTYIKKALNID